MYTVVMNELVKSEKSKIPRFLPNNLNLIKNNFNLTLNTMAEQLKLDVNFLGSVANQKANLSGKSVIKLMKLLNIDFNLIYNVNKEVEVSLPFINTHFTLIEVDSDKVLKNEEVINIFQDFCDKKQDEVVMYMFNKHIEFEGDKIKLELNKKEINILSDLIEDFNQFISSLKLDVSSNYYIICYVHVKNNNEKKYINLQNKLDYNLISYLNSKPFEVKRKYMEIKIPKENVKKIEDNMYYFYNDVINDNEEKVEIPDKINVNDCNENDTHIVYNKLMKKTCSTNKLNFVREYKGYTIKQMADLLGLSEETYKIIERGHQKFSSHVMWKIENELGVLLSSVINIDEYYKKFCIN